MGEFQTFLRYRYGHHVYARIPVTLTTDPKPSSLPVKLSVTRQGTSTLACSCGIRCSALLGCSVRFARYSTSVHLERISRVWCNGEDLVRHHSMTLPEQEEVIRDLDKHSSYLESLVPFRMSVSRKPEIILQIIENH